MNYIILISVLLLSFCHQNPVLASKQSRVDPLADKVTAETAKKIKNETGLHLMGTGGGVNLEGRLRKLNMSFIHYGDLSMEESRELVVYCVEEYLAAINADEKIRPHLSHYPFTPYGVEINIFIRQKDRQKQSIGYISVVSELNGKVSYKTSQPEPELMKKVHAEPYEEAKQLVKQQDPGMKRIKLIRENSS